MCGRYFLENTIEMKPFLEKMKRSSLVRRWNDTSAVITAGEIHPTDVVPVIASNQAGKQSVFPMRWGYSGKTLLINANLTILNGNILQQMTARKRPVTNT